MKRWLPAPLLSLALFAMWLLLNRSVSPGHLLLGALAGLAMPWLLHALRPPGGTMRHPLKLLKLVLVVGGDVVVSALVVGWGVLRARRRPPRGSFVVVPLDLPDARALAALAVVTTVVPGTVWCELAPDRSRLLLHVFDLDDEAAFVRHYKQRYELPLKEIFQ
ncbi:MAG TPA: Na+/H+ antiporter subunit E [Ramlibacter sp.]|jgi:multicomponent K+:H+ antiporter subunit E